MSAFLFVIFSQYVPGNSVEIIAMSFSLLVQFIFCDYHSFQLCFDVMEIEIIQVDKQLSSNTVQLIS